MGNSCFISKISCRANCRESDAKLMVLMLVFLNTLLNVTVLSLLLTIIGTWVGTKEITLDSIKNSPHIWPRNFGVAFWIELLIAQPIARFVMRKLHQSQARKAESI